jgi:hypothetical protein
MLDNTRARDFCAHYEVPQEFQDKTLSPLIKIDGSKAISLAFKLQAITNWGDKSFKDVWAMVTWNDTLKRKYEIMFVLMEIICVPCSL